MPSTLAVERLGHVNAFVDSYPAAVDLQRTLFGADVFREWTDDSVGSRNALALVGRTCIETFAATSANGPIGKWLQANGPGWHSLEWTVDSLDAAVLALGERGVRVTERTDNYAFAHPKDLHGLCLEITADRFAGDDRDRADWQPAYWSDEHPLGIVGGPTVKLASAAPRAAAEQLAELVGRSTYATEQTQLNAIGVGVQFADHAVEFIGSLTGVRTDLIGSFIAAQSERIFCVSLTVRDLAAARTFLVRHEVPFDQFGRHSLLLRPDAVQGARVEFTVAR